MKLDEQELAFLADNLKKSLFSISFLIITDDYFQNSAIIVDFYFQYFEGRIFLLFNPQPFDLLFRSI